MNTQPQTICVLSHTAGKTSVANAVEALGYDIFDVEDTSALRWIIPQLRDEITR